MRSPARVQPRAHVRSRVRGSASTTIAGLVLWLLTPAGVNVARAWSDAPFCDFPHATRDSHPASTEDAGDDELGMCAPGTPHLVRTSTFDTCAEASGRASPE